MLTKLTVPIFFVLDLTIPFILVTILFLEVERSNLLSHAPVVNLSIVLLPWLLLSFFGLYISWMNLRSSFQNSSCSYVTTKMLFFFSSNPISHKLAKHVELDYHFLRKVVVTGKLRTKNVPSHLKISDILTKKISQPLFKFSYPSFMFVQIWRSACRVLRMFSLVYVYYLTLNIFGCWGYFAFHYCLTYASYFTLDHWLISFIGLLPFHFNWNLFDLIWLCKW